ncbi:MAG: glycerophosphodiester phosphodiesterase [Longimicrobiales bacterium]
MLVAHRGGGRLAPENTMVAFQSALDDWGADMLELDVRLSRDGVVMVIHDETVDRTTDGTGRVSEFTLAELKEFDAGYRFEDLEGAPSFRGRGVRIPTLRELMEACPHVWLNIEAKEAQVAGPLVETIRSFGAEYRVLVAAEHERNRVAARGYQGPWGASRTDCLLFWALHRLPGGGGFTPKVDAFQIPDRWKGRQVLTPRLVEEAHRRNIPVHVWTIDEPDDMRRLLSWGVDAIQTDRPDLLSEVLVAESGRPFPPVKRRSGSL